MTLAERKKIWETHEGAPVPRDFSAFWQEQIESAAPADGFEMAEVDKGNPMASYFELSFAGTDGTPLKGRYIRPKGEGLVPTVLMFHEYNRSIRGWHHMTRFLALGYAVVALDNRDTVKKLAAGEGKSPADTLTQLYTDALTMTHVALQLPTTHPEQLITFGEGFGGGLALVVSALYPTAKCAVLNPMPADFRTVWGMEQSGLFYSGMRQLRPTPSDAFFATMDYVDCAQFAPMIQGELLFGTCLMDDVAHPITQYAIYHKATCEKRQITYPKHLHERINHFEDTMLQFLPMTTEGEDMP